LKEGESVAQRLLYNAPGLGSMARISQLLLVVLGLILWRVFFPALMSYDSAVQFNQAWVGRYNDWHPPLLAITLHLFLKAGRNIGALMLVQCLAGLFGLRALVLAWLRAFHGPAVSPRRAEAIALLVVLVLFLPVSPLPFYLVTFWKDSAAAVLLVWTCAVALPLVSRREEDAGGRFPWLRIAGVTALSVALGMVRHNAVAVLPAVSLVLGYAAARSLRRPATVAVALAPLLAFAVCDPALNRGFHVRKAHIERQMMVFDLFGMCALDARVCDSIPYVRSMFQVPDYRRRYVPGDLGNSFWAAPAVLDPKIQWDGDRLRAEYLRAARGFPGILARVKLEAFGTLLGVHEPLVFFHSTLADNKYGLRLNERFAPARAALAGWTLAAGRSPGWRLLSGVNVVWLLADCAWIVALVVARRRPLALVPLLPLAFYLSYLPATPSHDFRFMYPATLAVQAITFASLFALVQRSGRRSRTT
jgi:hypothetical protein